jgi:hypothetical protein
MNIREPPDFHARCETVTICSGAIAFVFSAPKTRYARHQLGQRGGLDPVGGVVRGDGLPALVVDEQPRARGDRRRRRRVRGRGERGGESER